MEPAKALAERRATKEDLQMNSFTNTEGEKNQKK